MGCLARRAALAATGLALAALVERVDAMEIENPPPADAERSQPSVDDAPAAGFERSQPSVDDAPAAGFERSQPSVDDAPPADAEPSALDDVN